MALIAIAFGANPTGVVHCGTNLYPHSCWAYCSGFSGNWCWTDEGVTCHHERGTPPGAGCDGNRCYGSSC